MKIGLQIPSFTWPGGSAALGRKLADIGRTADQAGFASIWVMDHFFQLDPMIGSADEPMLEGYSALTYLAAVTERARLGTLVSGVIYRQPAFLIKQVTNLDVLSGGRAYFGVGAAWYEREAVGLGFPYPPLKERFEWLEETLQLAHQMWADDRSPFNGAHFQLAEPICQPAAGQRSPSPDYDRRYGGAEDAAPGGPVRRRLQSLCADGHGRAETQAGRTARPLRGSRPAL